MGILVRIPFSQHWLFSRVASKLDLIFGMCSLSCSGSDQGSSQSVGGSGVGGGRDGEQVWISFIFMPKVPLSVCPEHVSIPLAQGGQNWGQVFVLLMRAQGPEEDLRLAWLFHFLMQKLAWKFPMMFSYLQWFVGLFKKQKNTILKTYFV